MPSGDKAMAKRLIACLDLTELKDDCTAEDVDRLLARARTPAGNVAAVCVWPCFVRQSKTTLAGSGIKVATVVNFPNGDENIGPAERETVLAMADGADEIDMVISWKKVRKDPAFVTRQVARLKSAAGGRQLKAILETGELDDPALIRKAAMAAIEGGADFIKTSTGKVPVGARVEAVTIMAEVARDMSRGTALKPSGGMKTLADARAMLEAAEAVLGKGWATPQTFRLGASSLLDDLLAHAAGKPRAKKSAAAGSY